MKDEFIHTETETRTRTGERTACTKSHTQDKAHYAEIPQFSNEELRALLPWPGANANKYSRGRAIVVAGCTNYPGAACMCSKAASRAGAGYVQVLCDAHTVPIVQSFMPSAVVSAWGKEAATAGETNAKTTANTENASEAKNTNAAAEEKGEEACDSLVRKVKPPAAYILGPGFDAQDPACKRVVQETLRAASKNALPLLIDAGALTILSNAEGTRLLHAFTSGGGEAVITPHAGEAARLATALDIDADALTPEQLACALCKTLGATVCLKGSDTYIATPASASPSATNAAPSTPQAAHAFATQPSPHATPPDSAHNALALYIMREGTSALAKAGTGDVLAGIIGGLLCQGLSPAHAAILGTTLHARGAACAARTLTSISVMPEDIIESIPTAIVQIDFTQPF